MALADELPKELHCALQFVVSFQTVSQGKSWSKKELIKETINQGKSLSENELVRLYEEVKERVSKESVRQGKGELKQELVRALIVSGRQLGLQLVLPDEFPMEF